MARARAGRSSHTRADGEPPWWEWLEQRPVGSASAVAVLLGWAILAVMYFGGVWTIDVVFFIAVGWLTLNLSFLSAFAAVVHWFHPHSSGRPNVLRLPEWLTDVEAYFLWLTPVIFIFGIIFGHYFWH